jgi:hypothetical protein
LPQCSRSSATTAHLASTLQLLRVLHHAGSPSFHLQVFDLCALELVCQHGMEGFVMTPFASKIR